MHKYFFICSLIVFLLMPCFQGTYFNLFCKKFIFFHVKNIVLLLLQYVILFEKKKPCWVGPLRMENWM